VRKYCYSEIGKRCVIKTHSQEVFKKYTAIFAISINGVIGWKLYEKSGIDSSRLKKFLEENITSKYKNKIVILDNASSHRNETIKNLINQNNKVLYSVPYQHFTNGIENFFSILKNKLQKEENITYNNIKRNITKIIRIIPKNIFYNIMKGTYSRNIKYIKKSIRKRNYKNYK
jgi:hypothetical protein